MKSGSPSKDMVGYNVNSTAEAVQPIRCLPLTS